MAVYRSVALMLQTLLSLMFGLLFFTLASNFCCLWPRLYTEPSLFNNPIVKNAVSDRTSCKGSSPKVAFDRPDATNAALDAAPSFSYIGELFLLLRPLLCLCTKPTLLNNPIVKNSVSDRVSCKGSSPKVAFDRPDAPNAALAAVPSSFFTLVRYFCCLRPLL